MQLVFSAEGRSWTLRLTGDARQTQRALLASLPLRLQFHTPKIAGSHIYWHAPFIEDVESATHVLESKAGAFIYWPVRQFLEITFAPLQAETAEVTVLGHLEGPVEGIATLAALLRREQGHRIIEGTLALAGGEPAAAAAPPSPLPADIVAARKAIWMRMPSDIAQITASRGIMHPAGPVFAAEAEARVLHEFLWWVRSKRDLMDGAVLRQTTALSLNKAATRLRDFCHMDQTSALLFRLEQAMGEALPFGALIDEAILVSGRIGAWLDLLIPWNDINETFRKALDKGK